MTQIMTNKDGAGLYESEYYCVEIGTGKRTGLFKAIKEGKAVKLYRYETKDGKPSRLNMSHVVASGA
ncbi:MAG: hypothetical protein IKS76_01590 [Paludibacteraceae bacterium]|nr:hypothetical protein [Paludibacteraceae bacterium]